jgi:GGDEF domain-containing protein
MGHRMHALYDSSIRDSLTGLLNRRGAIGVINKSLAHNAGNNATLLIDVDNLTKINDLRGHVAGDVAIACTVEVIRQSIREGDTCARIGGDEFIVFAPKWSKAPRKLPGKSWQDYPSRKCFWRASESVFRSGLPWTRGQTQTLPECIDRPTKRCIRPEGRAKAASASSPLPAS